MNLNICGIYGIRNENEGSSEYGKCYIGQSVDIYNRWYNHMYTHRRGLRKFYSIYKAFEKDGVQNFKLYIIEECKVEELDEKEIKWIKYYDSFNRGYNMTVGGNNGGVGVDNKNSSLNQEQLDIVIDLIENTNKTFEQISNQFKIARSVISNINTGKRYYNENLNYPLRPENLNYNTCLDCGKNIESRSTRCRECFISTISGENHYKSSLTEDIVYQIKKDIKNHIEFNSLIDIAKKYNIESYTVQAINTGTNWKHVAHNEFQYPIRTFTVETNKCIDCGKGISRESQRCKECHYESMRAVPKIARKYVL